MRPLYTLTPILLLGSCANMIVGEEQPSVFRTTTGDVSGEVSAEVDIDAIARADEDFAEAPPATTEAWRVKRGQVLRTFAFRALERGLIEEARGYLQEACQLDGNDIESHCALARLYLAEGDSRTAMAYAERAAVAAPGNPGVRLVYAATLAETGNEEEADRQVALAWKRSGHDPALAHAMVTHYAADATATEAQDFVREVLAEHPRDPRSWTAAGDLFLAQGQVDEAATAYAEAISLDPSVRTPQVLDSYLGRELRDVDPVVSSAVHAEQNGDLQGAERLYRYLLTAHPERHDLQAGLARVLWRRGRLEAAQTALDKIAVGQRTWREHLLEAKIRFQHEDWEGARGSLLLVLELRPELRAAELLLGQVDHNLTAATAAEGEAEAQVAAAEEEAAEAEPTAEETEDAEALDGSLAHAASADEADPVFGHPFATGPDGQPLAAWTVAEVTESSESQG